jgi:hypothetical protein
MTLPTLDRQGGLDLRGKYSARRSRDQGALGRSAEGELRLPYNRGSLHLTQVERNNQPS